MRQGRALGHEDVALAFERLFGRSLADAKKTALAQFDHGDAFGWVLPDGVIVSVVCDGDTIERDPIIAWLHDRINVVYQNHADDGRLEAARNECIVLRQRLAEAYNDSR